MYDVFGVFVSVMSSVTKTVFICLFDIVKHLDQLQLGSFVSCLSMGFVSQFLEFSFTYFRNFNFCEGSTC
jgi:hypothetical protein